MKSAMRLHPAYDPGAAVWFLEDGREARSLRELARLVGGASKLEGYAPGGYRAIRRADGVATRVHRPPVNKAPSIAGVARSRVKTAPVFPLEPEAVGDTPPVRRLPVVSEKAQRVGGAPRKLDHDAILDLWVTGMPGPEIARILGLNSEHAPRVVAQKGRKRGDLRAIDWAEKRKLKEGS